MARLDPRALIPRTVFQLQYLILSIQNLKHTIFKLHGRSSCEYNGNNHIPAAIEGYSQRIISTGNTMDECEVKFEMLGRTVDTCHYLLVLPVKG